MMQLLQKIYELMQENTIEAIHSSEPNLETVFLKLQEENLGGSVNEK